MKVEVYVNDGSKIVLTDEKFDAKSMVEKLNTPQNQAFEIGGAVLNRHAIQFILPEGTERVYPNREG